MAKTKKLSPGAERLIQIRTALEILKTQGITTAELMAVDLVDGNQDFAKELNAQNGPEDEAVTGASLALQMLENAETGVNDQVYEKIVQFFPQEIAA